MDLPVAAKSADSRPTDATPDIHGLADKASPGSILGWALDGARPGHRLSLELCLGDEVVGTGVADRPRADLEANGIGDGRHAFEIAVPPALLQRMGELRLFGLAANGTKVRIPLRARRPPPPPAAPAPIVAPGMTQEEGASLKAELDALAKRLNEMPGAKALHAVQAQQAALANQLRGISATLDQRLAGLASREQLAETRTAQEALVGRQDAATDRVVTLENWIARLEQQVDAIATNAKTPSATPARVDIWQKVLLGTFAGALVGALATSLILRLL